MHSCIHAFMHSCIHAFIHSWIHEFIHSSIHPFIIYLFIHSSIYASLFRLVNTKCMGLVDQWKKMSHSNLVTLRQVRQDLSQGQGRFTSDTRSFFGVRPYFISGKWIKISFFMYLFTNSFCTGVYQQIVWRSFHDLRVRLLPRSRYSYVEVVFFINKSIDSYCV